MKKITLLLFFVISFLSVNAQNLSVVNKEPEYNLLSRNVKPVTHRYDNNLRSPKATVVLQEDFNNATLPAGWSVIDNTSEGFTWTFVTDSDGNTLDGTPFAIIDSDAYGMNYLDTELISPAVDVSALNRVFLSFDQYRSTFASGDVDDVDVFDGTNWVNVFSMNLNNVGVADVGTWKIPDHQIIDVTAYKNANFKVRFHYYDAFWEHFWAIDNVMVFEPNINDLTIIDALPEAGIANTSIPLRVTVYNNGSATQDAFDVTFNIKDASNTSVFNETVNVTSAALSPFKTFEVASTTQPNLPVGTYTLEVSVALVGDTDMSNNTYSMLLPVIDFGGTYDLDAVYSYIVYDGDNSGDDNNTVYIDIETAKNYLLKKIDIDFYLTAGDFINDILVGVEMRTNSIYFIDGTTGTAYKYGTIKGDIEEEAAEEEIPYVKITGIAYNKDLNVGYISTTERFYSFDQNFNTTLLGALGSSLLIAGIGVDNDGYVYGINLGNDKLYKFEMGTGTTTAIGELGIDIQHAQDIGIDPVTGNLYGTLFQANAESGLYLIDKATGTATLIGDKKEDMYTLCAIKGTTVSVSENHIAGLKVYPNPTNGMIAVNAQENIQNIAIVNLAGQVVKTFDNNGLNAQLDVSDLDAGNYILKITTDKTVGSYQIIKR